ncbi:MAG: ADP-dependent glucokinase/phosphofructokinase [Candidatus Micrarchaeota archaeon]
MIHANSVELWNKRFQETKTAKLAKALVAFNANVDAVVLGLHQPAKALHGFMKEELESVEKQSESEPKEIRDEIDFFASLLHCIKTGKALHLHATQGVFDWFEKAFKPDERRMGGQAGIMANQLSAFHDFVLAYSALLSPAQASFFDQNVCFPTTSGKKLVCHPAKKVARKGDPTKVNWIFEFKAGEKMKFVSEFQAPRSNRLIVSSVLPYQPVFHNLDLKQLAKHADVAFLAGFHQLHKEKNFQEVLKKVVSQIEELQKANQTLVVHWEFVPIDDKRVEKQVLLSLGKPIQSFGLNEIEAVEVLQMIGAKKEADRIKKMENAFTLYKGCKKIMDLLKMERVHLHNLGFQLLVLKKPYPVPPEKARDALVLSSIIASLKAMKGRGFVSKQNLKSHSLLPSELGFNQLRALEGGIDDERTKRHSSFLRRELLENGIFDLDDHYVILVPSPIVKLQSTVGLGDVISSIALAAERG